MAVPKAVDVYDGIGYILREIERDRDRRLINQWVLVGCLRQPTPANQYLAGNPSRVEDDSPHCWRDAFTRRVDCYLRYSIKIVEFGVVHVWFQCYETVSYTHLTLPTKA